MIELSADECCGCMACLKSCPVDAIYISHDSKDNDYATVDLNKCIGCNKCEKVCPVINPVLFHQPQDIYAAISTNESVILHSSSGGAAYLIASKFIDTGGVVYGCKSSSLTNIEHVRIEEKSAVNNLFGSKYVKSDITLALPLILEDLKKGKPVLFIGTPCQVAAVIKFTGHHDNLYTIDLVCHGEPSIGFLKRYAHEVLGAKYNEDIIVKFRQKNPKIQFGTWFFDTSNGKPIKSQPFPKSPYMAAFFAGLNYRENCHYCKYAKPERVADMTLGDFWGLKSTKLDEQNGVSLIICSTKKGRSLFEMIKSMIILERHTIEEATKGNANLSAPFKRPYNKDAFYELLQTHTILSAVKKTLPLYRKANNSSFASSLSGV
ncbi:MAG: Coenzyme F420 hydrogenase/dehydrogenase, beta subunit C-terminal domain [Muribaculum sp.]|nr:Coenzyme F420 hydrogenase/dehydrogenase, beta subunit C-terminal domain [Muribaculum sp.]